MRLPIVVAALWLFVIAVLVVMPVFWQWSYRDRLIHVVPIGSTRDEYLKAMLDGHLGPGMLRPSYTFWRPFDTHGFVYTIVAYPEWNFSGSRLSGYGFSHKLSIRGHVYYLARWQGQEIL